MTSDDRVRMNSREQWRWFQSRVWNVASTCEKEDIFLFRQTVIKKILDSPEFRQFPVSVQRDLCAYLEGYTAGRFDGLCFFITDPVFSSESESSIVNASEAHAMAERAANGESSEIKRCVAEIKVFIRGAATRGQFHVKVEKKMLVSAFEDFQFRSAMKVIGSPTHGYKVEHFSGSDQRDGSSWDYYTISW